MDVGEIVERFNLARTWHWFGLAGLVGVVGGLGALVFQWMTERATLIFWGWMAGWVPPGPGGEHLPFTSSAAGPHSWALIVGPIIGGAVSAWLVYRFAPEAEGHGTDRAIYAYHRDRGRTRRITPIIKMLASAFTLGSGGSAGREGPIAQIGGGFGSWLGDIMHLSDRERRILLMAGVAAGIGAIFRAPLAGAIFSAEVLYKDPDIEAEVVIPALISSIVSYSIYCSVHGFGHLFTGTEGFAFGSPLSLVPYLVLGFAVAFASIGYVVFFNKTTEFFKKLPITPYAKPVIGAGLTGLLGLLTWKVTGDLGGLGVMGSGYGILQDVMRPGSIVGHSALLLAMVAVGKIVTTSLTIGSGGSGGVFGPSMVIGGLIGAVVGTLFHQVMPEIVPSIGPFAIVGMVGFFAGAANTPISTLLMAGDMTGNYSLLIPSMLVVTIALFVGHRWTIYPEQVRTRADSPAHRGEFMLDVLSDLTVAQVFDPDREIQTVLPSTHLSKIVDLVVSTHQQYFPVVDAGREVVGIFSLNDMREVLYEEGLADLVVAADIATSEVLCVTPSDTLQEALQLLTVRNIDELPVVTTREDHHLEGILTRRDIISAYHRHLGELRAGLSGT